MVYFLTHKFKIKVQYSQINSNYTFYSHTVLGVKIVIYWKMVTASNFEPNVKQVLFHTKK